MNEIRAFVGHSFVEDDAELVDKFLKYFDRITKLHPTFSWEHAEAAEPKLLTEKVMSLIANKNVFIGICTKKERVINPDSLSTVFFQPSYLKAKEADLEWKTSDWIIQEIGMAKGLGLEIILLIEDGVRKPGGLQGDVEYIPFSRSALEKSFSKILEMITALSPKSSSSSTTSPDSKSSTSEKQEEPLIPADTEKMTPMPTWQRTNYEHAMLRMIMNEDTAGADSINRAYLATLEAEQGDNRYTWEAHREWLCLIFGSGGNLGKLRTLAQDHPTNRKILEYLAKGLADYGNHEDAASRYEAAANVVSETVESKWLMGLAAVQYLRAGESEKTAEIVSQLKTATETGIITELQLLKTLRELAEFAKQDDALVAIMERLVELVPEDFNTRFSLAYKHSQNGNNDLALSNYLKIPYQERNRMAWNNLGVAYGQFQLQDKAVRAFRKAEEMGETLAMSNLANKLFNIGMIPDAQAKCDQALAIKDYHKNIASLNLRLKELPEEEEKKQDEVLEKAKPKSEFYRSFGRVISRIAPNVLGERWQGPDCMLEVKLSGSTLHISGAYERDPSPLAMLGRGSFAKQKIRYRVEYLGTLRGYAIDGTITRTMDGDTPTAAATLLDLAENTLKVLMLLSDDLTEIKVMENPHNANSTFYSIKQLTPTIV